jgi:hypothetical protein
MYQRTRTIVEARIIEDSGWSPWRQVTDKGWWFLNIADWERERSFLVEYVNAVITEDCSNLATDFGPPPGGPTSSPGYYYWYWRRLSTRVISSTGRRDRFWDTQRETRWFDPPKELPEVRALVGPTLLRGDQLRLETNWMPKLPEVRSARVTLDAQPIKHNQLIRLATLNAGMHALDIAATMSDGSERALQIAFSVQNKLDLRFAKPVQRVNVSDDPKRPNGTSFVLDLRNNTAKPIGAVVELADVPEGWRAGLNNQSIIAVRPNRPTRLSMQVEMMNDSGLSEGLLPVSIAASSDLGAYLRNRARFRDVVVATAYVEPRARPRLAKVMLTNKARLKKKRPIAY